MQAPVSSDNTNVSCAHISTSPLREEIVMRVPTVSKINTRQQQNPHNSQNTVNAITGKSAAAKSFEDCLKSFYQQRDSQKKARSTEYKTEDVSIELSANDSTLPEPDIKHIDIKR